MMITRERYPGLVTATLVALAFVASCDAEAESAEPVEESGEAVTPASAALASPAPADAGSNNVYSGTLSVSSTTVAVGVPFTVTQSATNLTDVTVGPIILGIRRLGFSVTNVTRPRTGACRIAGSATCNFIQLAPRETQTYTLTLTAETRGTFAIRGWTTSSYVAGGGSTALTVVVR